MREIQETYPRLVVSTLSLLHFSDRLKGSESTVRMGEHNRRQNWFGQTETTARGGTRIDDRQTVTTATIYKDHAMDDEGARLQRQSPATVRKG